MIHKRKFEKNPTDEIKYDQNWYWYYYLLDHSRVYHQQVNLVFDISQPLSCPLQIKLDTGLVIRLSLATCGSTMSYTSGVIWSLIVREISV